MSVNVEQKRMEIVDRMFENVKAVLVRSTDRDHKLGNARKDVDVMLNESLENLSKIAEACPFVIDKPIWVVMRPLERLIIKYFDCVKQPEYNDDEFLTDFRKEIFIWIIIVKFEIYPVEFHAELHRELAVENHGLPYANEGMEYAQKTGLLDSLRAKFSRKSALHDKMKQGETRALNGDDGSLGVMDG